MENETEQNIQIVQPVVQEPISVSSLLKKKKTPLLYVLGLVIISVAVFIGVQISKKQITNQQPVVVLPTPIIPNQTIDSIINALKAGKTIKNINNPSLKLPSNINEAQILNYFQLDNIYFALVMKNSMNVVLNTPKDYNTIFAGVLVSKQGDSQWVSFAEIQDEQANSKNNPYYLWTDSNKLMLSVVDQNGAGSGEGIMKLFTFSGNGDWELKGCYYFGGTYSDSSVDGDYFAYSSILSKQTPKSLNECNNVIITSRK